MLLQQSGKEKAAVRNCGLVLHPNCRYIGASPDGLVFDPSEDSCHGLLEIQCPLNAFDNDLTPEKAGADTGFCCELQEGKIHWKDNHPYCYQVQEQLGVSGLLWCDFLVWTGPRRVACERLRFNEKFWIEQILAPPTDFYFKVMLRTVFRLA